MFWVEEHVSQGSAQPGLEADRFTLFFLLFFSSWKIERCGEVGMTEVMLQSSSSSSLSVSSFLNNQQHNGLALGFCYAESKADMVWVDWHPGGARLIRWAYFWRPSIPVCDLERQAPLENDAILRCTFFET